MAWKIVFVVSFLVFVRGYEILMGEDDTDCMNNPGGMVLQPGTGCKQFLLCDSGGLAFGPQDCAHGTLFDSETQECIHADDVKCPESIDINIPECVTEAVPPDCQTYTQCVMGAMFYRDCPNTTVYSNTMHTCVYITDLSDHQKALCHG